MPHIIVASTNPVKINAVLAGFRRMFPENSWTAQGLNVASGVADQPMGDEDTLTGARNRACAAREAAPEADYWVGVEGGCAEDLHGMTCFAWVFILTNERQGQARTGAFYLPEEVAELVRSGIELGHADDQVFGRENSKQQDGSVGLMTGGVIDRTEYYTHAVILALVPFKTPHLTFPTG